MHSFFLKDLNLGSNSSAPQPLTTGPVEWFLIIEWLLTSYYTVTFFAFRFKTSFPEILTLLSFACLSLDRGRYLLERILIINMPFHILSYSRVGNTREAFKDSDCEMGGMSSAKMKDIE